MVSLVSISQALGNQVNQRSSFLFPSVHHGKLQSRRTCNSGLPRYRESLRQCLHNGLRYKIYHLVLPTKLCRWLSEFLVERVIQVKIECFLSPKVYLKAGVPQGSNLSPLLFLIYVNDMPNPCHHRTNKSQFADDAGQWAVSKSVDLAVEYLQRDLDKLARWCAKWRIKLNPEKTKGHNILQVPNCNKGKACFIFIWRPSFVLSSHKVLRYHF